MTVRETILFNFLLTRNLPAGSGVAAELKKNVSKIIDMQLSDLGLAKVADTKIGDHTVRGISGGQKRRVTLAKGLVSGAASVLFCDEPCADALQPPGTLPQRHFLALPQ
jgi:ABC-type multidrug transport system ATPase subunit